MYKIKEFSPTKNSLQSFERITQNQMKIANECIRVVDRAQVALVPKLSDAIVIFF